MNTLKIAGITSVMAVVLVAQHLSFILHRIQRWTHVKTRRADLKFDPLKTNADGSIDLYFGPTAPAGVDAASFRQTVPGKGWYPMVRFYTPTAGLLDGTCALPDLEVVK